MRTPKLMYALAVAMGLAQGACAADSTPSRRPHADQRHF